MAEMAEMSSFSLELTECKLFLQPFLPHHDGTTNHHPALAPPWWPPPGWPQWQPRLRWGQPQQQLPPPLGRRRRSAEPGTGVRQRRHLRRPGDRCAAAAGGWGWGWGGGLLVWVMVSQGRKTVRVEIILSLRNVGRVGGLYHWRTPAWQAKQKNKMTRERETSARRYCMQQFYWST